MPKFYFLTYSTSKYATASVPCKDRSVPIEWAKVSSSVQAASQGNCIKDEEKNLITWTPCAKVIFFDLFYITICYSICALQGQECTQIVRHSKFLCSGSLPGEITSRMKKKKFITFTPCAKVIFFDLFYITIRYSICALQGQECTQRVRHGKFLCSGS